MIIIYNIKEKTLNSRTLSIEKDPLTRNKSNIQLFVVQKYLDLFGPMAPLGAQEVIAVDTDLDQQIDKKQWPDSISAEAKRLKEDTPYAWGLFRNLFIIIGIFGLLAIIGPIIQKNRAARTAANMETQKADYASVNTGDVLTVRYLSAEGISGVSLMKVVRINGDTIVVRRNKIISDNLLPDESANMDHSDATFEPTHESFMLAGFKQYQNLTPFPDADGHRTMAIASALGIEKAK